MKETKENTCGEGNLANCGGSCVPLEDSARERAARAEFLRCLCKELRGQNTAVLFAAAGESDDPVQLRQWLQQAGAAAHSQQELLGMLENLLRIY